jgi:hypothetical protein
MPDLLRLKDIKTIRKTMYIPQILQYLIWPVFILICWFAIKAGLSYYETKYPEKDNTAGTPL